MIKMVAHDRKNEKKTCIKNPKSSSQAVMQCLFTKCICHQLHPNDSSLFLSRPAELFIVLVADIYIISLKVQGNFVLYTYVVQCSERNNNINTTFGGKQESATGFVMHTPMHLSTGFRVLVCASLYRCWPRFAGFRIGVRMYLLSG